MPKEYYVLDFRDNNDIQCVFTKSNCEKHQVKHPELGRKTYLQESVRKAVIEPDFIYPSYGNKTRFCFYLKEYVINGKPDRKSVV